MIDKEFLSLHYELINEYQQEVQRLEEYSGKAVPLTPVDMDGMPHAVGVHSDRTASWVMRKSLLEESISELQKVIVDEEKQIESVVRQLRRAKEKTVIRLRYINGLSWDDVTFFFYGDKQDYCEQADWYKMKVLRVHGSALKNIVKVQENNA